MLERFHKRMRDGQWALLPLRLMIGFGFAEHGYAKLIRGPESFGAILAAIGAPLPGATAWVTSLLELLGGLCVMAGAFVVPFSIPLLVLMLTAIFTVHLPNGFATVKLRGFANGRAEFGPPGYEMNVIYIASLITLTLSGSGALSVDNLIAARRRSRSVLAKGGVNPSYRTEPAN